MSNLVTNASDVHAKQPPVTAVQPARDLSLRSVMAKTVVVHTVTYFVAGILAFTLFDYATKFADPRLGGLLRPTNTPIVAAGPALQVVRGLMFGVVFYLLRDPLFTRPRGWLTLWTTLVVVGIFSTFGPAPGSVEGLIYTTLPVGGQLGGLIEVIAQALLLSVVLFYWVNHPEKRWLNWVLGGFFVLVLVFSALGYFLA
ncbi:MAG: hypothetical protein KDD83_05475 [Caldilineaceae bacterium]|nr:hypothetical protein [Caldilineaceae bacterium]